MQVVRTEALQEKVQQQESLHQDFHLAREMLEQHHKRLAKEASPPVHVPCDAAEANRANPFMRSNYPLATRYVAQAAECRERISASEDEIRRLQEKLAAAQQEIEQHANTIAQLQAQLQEEQGHRSAAEGKIKTLTDQNTDMVAKHGKLLDEKAQAKAAFETQLQQKDEDHRTLHTRECSWLPISHYSQSKA
jgi:hypothetical protein